MLGGQIITGSKNTSWLRNNLQLFLVAAQSIDCCLLEQRFPKPTFNGWVGDKIDNKKYFRK